MLIDYTLFGKIDKIKTAIERIKEHEPPEGYYLANSYGKDSTVIHELSKMAGVKFESHHNLTTVDPPELMQHGKKYFFDTIINRPKENMWQLIVRYGIPPLRQQRWCCRLLKERGGNGRTVITGIRAEESARRKAKWKVFNQSYDKKKFILNPILDWTELDVWNFHEKYNLPHCSLYDDDFARLGCIGCPMQNTKGMERDFARWPKYYSNYIKAFDRMLVERERKGRKAYQWKDGKEVMDWWLYGNPKEEGELFK